MRSLFTGIGFFLVDFPLRLPISGPKIFSAFEMSSTVTGQFWIKFCRRIDLKQLGTQGYDKVFLPVWRPQTVSQ
jgi:hypothetical protein